MRAEPPIPELGRVAASAITEVLATQFRDQITDESAADMTGEVCNMLAGRVAAIPPQQATPAN